MGVRPPKRNAENADETVAFGIAALDEHLERSDVSYPTTTDQLVDDLGDPSVPYDVSGREVALSTVLEETSADTFGTRQQLLNELHPVFEAKRERANRSLVGRLRALFPR